MFDVVDAEDRVIGQAPRGEVHARGWRHRAVHVFVVNAAGEVFLQQRSMRKDLFPGRWNSSCAGHVDAGEDYDGAVVRELQEELGLEVAGDERRGAGDRRPPVRRWFRVEARPETGQEFVWVYGVVAEGPFVLNAAEIQRGGWFSVAAIDAWVAARPEEFADSLVFLWPQVRARV